MPTVIISIIVAAVCVYSAYSYIKKLRHGGGCCGEHDAAEKKVRVTDRNQSHYPYALTLTIDGMTCGNCTRRVENALNRLDGVWATVDLGERRAYVRLKHSPDEIALKQAVRDSGYTVLSIQNSSTLPSS